MAELYIPLVVFINPSSSVGGAEVSLLETLKWVGDRCRFHVVLPNDGPLAELARQRGAVVSLLEWPPSLLRVGERNKSLFTYANGLACIRIPFLLWRLRNHLTRLRPDLVVTNGIKAHILGSLAMPPHCARLLWYLRDGLEGRKYTTLLLSLLAKRCNAVIAISHYIANEARAISGLPSIQVVYNIVDLQQFRPGLPAPDDLQKPLGEVWFGVIGALTPLKGQDLFLEAAEQVLRTIPHARFLIVGSNAYDTEGSAFESVLHARAASPLLDGKVRILGFREDAPRIYGALDGLIQCNRGPEGLGRTVLEAMACGVPVIAVDQWGPGETVQHGITGLKFPPGEVSALADCMVRLATEDALRQELIENGRRWAEEHLDPRSTSHTLAGIFCRASAQDLQKS